MSAEDRYRRNVPGAFCPPPSPPDPQCAMVANQVSDMVNKDTQPNKSGDTDDRVPDDDDDRDEVNFDQLQDDLQDSHIDPEDDADADTGPEPLPPELVDDVVGIDIGSVERETVDVAELAVPRPVNNLVGAKYLTYGGYTNAIIDEVLPDRRDDDHEHQDECLLECECGAEEHNAELREEHGVDTNNDLPAHVRHKTEDCDCEFGCVCTHHSESGARLSRHCQRIQTHTAEEASTPSLYGIVVKRLDPKGYGDNEIRVRLADEHGMVDVVLYDSMDLPEFDAGDEVLVTDLKFDESSEGGDWIATEPTDVQCVKTRSKPPGALLRERSQLERADEMFKEYESTQEVCEWAAEILTDEWHIETPRGKDEIYLYIDEDESDDYGLVVNNGADWIREFIDAYFPRGQRSSRNKNEIVAQVRDRTRVESGAFTGGAPEHEARRWSVACENGVVDLRTGELHEFDPAWRCRSKLPVTYDEDVPAELGPEWDWFLSEVTKDESDRESILYMIGHALARCYPVEAVWFLIGPGKNGKTVLQKALKQLFGDNAGDFDLKSLTGGSEFGTGALQGNHIAIDDDATDVKVNDLSILKRHTGGGSAEINRKHEKRESYDNYATMAANTNNPPAFGDLSDGAKRRVYPVIMPHKFTDDPTDDHKDAVPETELMDRLTSEDELQRLLRVAVEYAAEMYETGEVQDGRTDDERWQLYQQYSDSILQFWRTCSVSEKGARVPTSVWYEVYTQYCQANGIDPVPRKGRNSFWSLSDGCPAVSYKREGVWIGDDMATEHVMMSETAIEFAPEWVVDEWSDEVDESTSTLGNRLDRVTPIGDIKSKGYCTTQGRVIGRENVETQRGMAVKLTIEDETRAIDVWEYPDEDADAKTDVAKHGDTVTLKRAVLTSNRGEPMLKIVNVSEVTVTETGPLTEGDDQHVSDADAADQGSLDVRGDGDGDPVNDDAESSVQQSGSDPDAPDRMAEQDVQCRSCGVYWPVVTPNGSRDSVQYRCESCGERVDLAWNVDARATDTETLVEHGFDVDEFLARGVDGDESVSQDDRIETVRSVISDLEGDAGAPVEDVLDELESRGIARDTAQDEIESLRFDGEVYEPQSDHLRAVTGGD